MGLTKRLLYMDTRRGCWSKRSPTPWKNENFFFAVWGAFLLLFFHREGFMLRFSSYEGLFHCMEAFLLLFLYVGGFFATSSFWCGAFFTTWGPFLLFFSPCGRTFFVFIGDFMSLWFFYGLAPSPHDFF